MLQIFSGVVCHLISNNVDPIYLTRKFPLKKKKMECMKRPFGFQSSQQLPLKTSCVFGHLRDFAESFLEGNVQQSSTVFLKNTKK